MKIILASGNKGKIQEIQNYYKKGEVLPYTDIIKKFEIMENATTYKENALIKAKAVYEKIKNSLDENFIVLSDDSGISVKALDDKPGVFSARFAGKNATDQENLNKLIQELKKRKIKKTPAYYTAAMAIVSRTGKYTVHGWMHGDVIDKALGDGGFGYDPMFIPKGFNKTLGELDKEIKQKISHRTKALSLAKYIIDLLNIK